MWLNWSQSVRTMLFSRCECLTRWRDAVLSSRVLTACEYATLQIKRTRVRGRLICIRQNCTLTCYLDACKLHKRMHTDSSLSLYPLIRYDYEAGSNCERGPVDSRRKLPAKLIWDKWEPRATFKKHQIAMLPEAINVREVSEKRFLVSVEYTNCVGWNVDNEIKTNTTALLLHWNKALVWINRNIIHCKRASL